MITRSRGRESEMIFDRSPELPCSLNFAQLALLILQLMSGGELFQAEISAPSYLYDTAATSVFRI